ncbi:MAG: hypothetical protein Tsb0032_10660 [Kiloniellaceae bacterium]
MKLNANQIAAVKQDLSADPLEEQNPAMGALRKAFGDHTFYVGDEGLFVVEPVEDEKHPGEPAQLILVAAWSDDSKKALQPVPPQETETVVDLAAVAKGRKGEA